MLQATPIPQQTPEDDLQLQTQNQHLLSSRIIYLNPEEAHLRYRRDVSDESEENFRTYRFYPYFRLRHVERVQSEPPLSNYEDSYDKFPTDF